MLFKKYKALIISIAISLGIGALSSLFLGGDTKEYYMSLSRPPLSPPSIVFPIVWTILYILMGISAYLVYKSNCKEKNTALILYGVQLFINFMWTILFFKLHLMLFSFIWLLLLIFVLILLFKKFYSCSKIAAYLLITYILWCMFAAYLNLGIFILNR